MPGQVKEREGRVERDATTAVSAVDENGEESAADLTAIPQLPVFAVSRTSDEQHKWHSTVAQSASAEVLSYALTVTVCLYV